MVFSPYESKPQKEKTIYSSYQRISTIFISSLILLILCPFIYAKSPSRILISRVSQIHLVVSGTGTQEILSDQFSIDLDTIEIKYSLNGGEKTRLQKKNITSLTGDKNNITLEFTTQLTTCENIFKGLANIVKIDLSEFDASEVTNMLTAFQDCTNLISINFGNLNTQKLTSLRGAFYQCSKLVSVDISNINTSSVTNMHDMFNSCTSLQSIDLSHFRTPKLESMQLMFYKCSQLISIDLSNFDTSNVNDTSYLFNGCESLTFINIQTFNTSSVTTMKYMFNRCRSLKSLDVSHFETSKVRTFDYMFNNCANLTALNLSNFNYGNANSMIYMFSGCLSLKYLNMYSCTITAANNINITNALNNVPLDLVYCIHHAEAKNYFFQSNYVPICSDTCYDENNIIIDTSLQLCREPYHSDELSTNYEESPSTDLHQSSQVSDSPSTNLHESSYISDSPSTNLPESSYVSDSPSTNLHESSYVTDSPNTNIQESSYATTKPSSYIYESTYNIDEDDMQNIITEIIRPIPDEWSTYNNSEIYTIIIEKILNEYTSENGKDIIIKGAEDTIFQITNRINELELIKNKSNNIHNLSIIDLGECENKLKQAYHINENDSLIYVKNEKITNKASEKSVRYDIFEPYNKTKLNLSICEDTPINIYIAAELSKENKAIYEQLKGLGYDMFDINDEFYTDVCTPFDSVNGTDILLEDRIDYIYNNDDTKCQSNCEFSSYLIDSQYLNCSCSAHEQPTNIPTEKKEKFSAKKIYESFYEVLKYSNYKIMKCLQLIFGISGIKNNIGSITVISFVSCYLGCSVVFLIKGTSSLKLILGNNIKHMNIHNTNLLDTNDKNKINSILFPPKKKSRTNKMPSPDKKEKRNKKDKKAKKGKNERKERKEKGNKKSKKDKKEKEKESRKTKSFITKQNINSTIQIYSGPFKSNEKIMNNVNVEKPIIEKRKKSAELSDNQLNKPENQPNQVFDDFELNGLAFEESVVYDKRTLFQMYLARLKREHLIIFTFFVCDDYNLLFVKISRFIFLLVSDMALNVFFFSDASMHKLFLSYGKYDIFQRIPQIIYTTIISQLIEVFLCFLTMTDKYIYQIKELYKSGKNEQTEEILKCIKIKLIVFYIFTFIFFMVYWYIITAFCSVYKNTQLIFIKDSLISFTICMIYPLFLYFISSLLRFCSVRDSKKRFRCIYKLSDFIPFF